MRSCFSLLSKKLIVSRSLLLNEPQNFGITASTYTAKYSGCGYGSSNLTLFFQCCKTNLYASVCVIFEKKQKGCRALLDLPETENNHTEYKIILAYNHS